MIELEIFEIKGAGKSSDAFFVFLKEKEGDRVMPIIMGWSETRSLFVANYKTALSRPSSHDLVLSFCDKANIKLLSVYITKFENGIFYSIISYSLNNELFNIDARPSDSISLALKKEIPIYIEERLFEEQMIKEEKEQDNDTRENNFELLDHDEIDNIDTLFFESELSKMSINKLNALLQGAIESEDFELASKIQEAIQKKS